MNNLGTNTASTNATTGGTTGTANGDFLDKGKFQVPICIWPALTQTGVDKALKQGGHGQSASTTEKISDVLRSGIKKVCLSRFWCEFVLTSQVTGKDVGTDKQMTSN